MVASMPGFRCPEEFLAWQLAWELKERVQAFTATEPAARDRKFCEEIRESARSAPDNISEGFYRFNPPDFANFVRIARGSVGEVRNQLKHARSRRYLSEERLRRPVSSVQARDRRRHGTSPVPPQPAEELRPEN
ncbi:MAG: four helix bundle protein [Acidobacteria bacterium]|nr:MAG: four helix bundle protein [Acidobacteriota bacterium]